MTLRQFVEQFHCYVGMNSVPLCNEKLFKWDVFFLKPLCVIIHLDQ